VRLYPEEVVPRHAVMMFGPVVAPMERVGGRYRYQLLLQANQRNYLNQLLLTIRHQLEADKHARKVRWSIDVDPVDFF
jgi:primosomal protein N' (replication factor Y)